MLRINRAGRRWGGGRKGGGCPSCDIGEKKGKGPLPQLPSSNPLSARRKRALIADYVVTEGLRSKLRDKWSGGTSSIFGGLFTHLRHLRKTSVVALAGGCQVPFSESQRRQVERCKIEDMNCRKETPFPVGWESWETRSFNRANGSLSFV